jgi:hypothetical protein
MKHAMKSRGPDAMKKSSDARYSDAGLRDATIQTDIVDDLIT